MNKITEVYRRFHAQNPTPNNLLGQQGEKGSPDGSARNKAFKARHAKNIARGKMSGAFWSNKEKW